MKIRITLVFLTAVAFFLRFWGEPEHPQGFYQDEAGIAYSAYSVLKTGRDEWGNLLPLHFKALGDYPPGIYNYLTAISISFFGLTEMAERFPSISFGALLVPVTFYLIFEYTKSKNFSLLIGFLIAFSPWDIVQSRAGSEPIAALVFTFLAWILYKRWAKKPKVIYFVSICLLYFLAIFSYNSVKFSLPLLHGLLVWYLWTETKNKKAALYSVPVLMFFAVMSVFAINGADKPYQNSFIFLKDYSNDSQAYFFREGNKDLPLILSRIFHNRYVLIFQDILGRFWGYLSGNIMFFQGGLPGRYKIPGVGFILPVLSPFLLLGIIQQRYLNKKTKLLLISWIVAGLLPGVLFVDFYPHVKRIMYAYLPFYLLIGVGLTVFYQSMSKKIIRIAAIAVLTGLFVWNFAYSVNQYLIHAQYETVMARSYGWKDILDTASKIENTYEQVAIYSHNEDPVVFYLFYNKIEPRLIQSAAETRPINVFLPDGMKKVWNFNNYVFHPYPCPDQLDLKPGILYLTIAECTNPKSTTLPTDALNILKSTYMPDGSPRFILFEKALKT